LARPDAPTDAPISPGCNNPIVVIPALLADPILRPPV
jgi:hypothetical protein